MLVTLGPNRATAVGTLHDVTFIQLVDWLRAHHPRGLSSIAAEYGALVGLPAASEGGQRLANAKDGPWVAFAQFEGNRRHLSCLPRGCAIPLDLDHTQHTPDTIALALHGHNYCLLTTFGHRAAAPRWRVIVPVDGITDAATHRSTWNTLNALMGGGADPAAKDVSRLNYLPGPCIEPESAGVWAVTDAQNFPVVPAPPETASATPLAGDGPVEGWCGPFDDRELLMAAFRVRTRVEERFGQLTLLEALWRGDTDVLGQRYPAKEPHQQWENHRATTALVNELMYFTGNDRERTVHLALQANCMQQIGKDHERKVRAALSLVEDKADVYSWPQGQSASPPFTPPPERVATLEPSAADPAAHSLKEQGASAPEGLSVAAGDVPIHPSHAAVSVGSNNGATLGPPGHGDAATGDPSFPTAERQRPAGQQAGPSQPVGDLPPTPPLLHPEDFYAYLKEHKYVYRPTRDLWVASSLSGELRALVDIERPVHRLTWAPGMVERFRAADWDASDEKGAQTWYYNLYAAPRRYDTGDVTPWLEFLQRLYPDDARHLVMWMADRVQNPGRKINHAVVLGSRTHGIGKDTLLAPLQLAVGEANYATISPARIGSRFNGYRQSVVCQISEARNTGDESSGGGKVDRYAFYEAMKDLCAAPPTRLEVDNKNVKEYWVANVVGPIITTNHYTDGLYVPAEDRRYYCAWSNATQLPDSDAKAIWRWYETGGLQAVAGYLAAVDLSAWDRAAPPPHTAWWHELVANGVPAEEAGLHDAIAKLGSPDRMSVSELVRASDVETAGWLQAPANRKKIAHRLSGMGYERHRNPSDKTGRWFTDGKYQVVYRRAR